VPFEIEVDKYHPKDLTMITKRIWESESPWRMPQVGEKGLEGTLLTKIKKKVEELSFMI
jgi:hypothetical protein